MNPPISEAAAEALREPGRGLPVFVSADGRRRRALRLAGRVVAGLTALWLVALVAGTLGLGDLPGVSLPRMAADDSAEAPAQKAPAGPGAQREGSRDSTTSHSRRHDGPTGVRPPPGVLQLRAV